MDTGKCGWKWRIRKKKGNSKDNNVTFIAPVYATQTEVSSLAFPPVASPPFTFPPVAFPPVAAHIPCNLNTV